MGLSAGAKRRDCPHPSFPPECGALQPQPRPDQGGLAGEMVEVLSIQCYKAHMVPEDGSLTCLKAGVWKYWQETTALEPGSWGPES